MELKMELKQELNADEDGTRILQLLKLLALHESEWKQCVRFDSDNYTRILVRLYHGGDAAESDTESAAQLAYLRAVDFTMSTLTALSSRSTLPAVHTVQQHRCAVAMVSQQQACYLRGFAPFDKHPTP